MRRDLNSGLVSTKIILSAILEVELGSNKASFRPITSGRLVVLAAITGAPKLIASRGGNPKPSKKEGNTNTAQLR